MPNAKLRRKPVPSVEPESPAKGLDQDIQSLTISTEAEILDDPGANLVLSPASTNLSSIGEGSEWSPISPTATNLSSIGEGSEWSPISPTESRSSSKSSIWKTAYDGTRHFAGGLVSHPYEASKHYSILRHSHGIVYFKGFSTNIAISIFGDRPLPDDRQFWLQKRGFSGSTGLKIGASIVGTKGAWINVTPTTRCTPDQLPQSDERAWQRDIAKFLKKAGKDVRSHLALETCVLRIPCSAEDGYFRVVLCTGDRGKKTLCPSPVFRVASTSMSMGSIRGASLSTLPLELSVKVGQFVAKQVAYNAAAPFAGTALQQAQSLLPWQPNGIIQDAAVSQVQSSATSKVEDAHSYAEDEEQRQVDKLVSEFQDQLDHTEVIGKDSGPEPPYPICFSAKVVEGTGRSRTEMGIPTANLSKISDSTALRLSGTYFGWITFASTKGLDVPDYLQDDWHHVILNVSPLNDSKAAVVMDKDFSAYLIADFHDSNFVDAKLSFVIMGRLRQQASHFHLDEAIPPKTRLVALFRDIAVTQASLARPEWAADNTLTRVKTDKSNRSFKEHYAAARGSVQEQVDKVPVHMAGVRTNSMALRDQLVGNGGVWVPR